MNDNFDHIRRIQTQLSGTLCRGCRGQGLTLLLRYHGQKGQCFFMAICRGCHQTCQMMDVVDPGTAHRLDVQEPHEHGTVSAILARP